MTPKNKINIDNPVELVRVEERISKQNAIELWNSNSLTTMQAGTFAALSYIHRTLFGDIYEFAGQMRDVNISKGYFRFASAMYLREAVMTVEQMPQSTFNEIIEKYVEMNVAHPFREGNGRSMRMWLDHILKTEIKQVVDWNSVDKNNYL